MVGFLRALRVFAVKDSTLGLLREEKSIAQLAAEHGVHPTPLGKGKALALHALPSLFEERAVVKARKASHEAQLTALYAQIGRFTTQAAWLKKKLGLPPG